MKEWAWSYSKKKNFDTCPKRHYEVDIAKSYKDESEQLEWGNRVHKALADACSGKAPLPPTMTEYQKWVDRVRAGQGELLVEQKYAIARDFTPVEWFSPRAWYRGIGDVVRIAGPVALGLDWKTGKVLHDSRQLMLMAQCIFSHFPDVKVIRTEFVWLKEDCTTPETFTRDQMVREWTVLLPEIRAMEDASKRMDYPPRPSRLCFKNCPVLSCPHHGKRSS